ncbi:MAG: hypothetical protein K6B52_01715 [Clostridiales bacterium]|nr:hypothetical protein [Clostridiales bacterium]
MSKIIMTKPSESGIALGGIGAGSVELMPDGEFHYWQIANPPRMTDVCWERKEYDGESHTGALSFWVRAQRENSRPVVRRLGMKTDQDDFSYRMFPWSKPVEKIIFDGRFPVCEIEYEDRALPCRITGRAVSPFVPHHSDISAAPGFYMDFEIENTQDSELTLSLLGTLVPEFCNKGGCRNIPGKDSENINITLYPAQKTDAPDCGEVCLSIGGDGEKSCITGEYRRFMREYIFDDDKFGVSQESVLFGFRETGCLPDSEAVTPPPDIPENSESLSEEETDRLFNIYTEYPFAASVLQRIRDVNPSFPSDRDEKLSFLRSLRAQSRHIKPEEFGAAALCSTVKLAPGEKKTVRFVMTWYFPNHFSKDGRRLGHYYENLFSGAADVNAFLRKNRADVFDKAVAFSNLLYNTDLPEIYPECWSGHLNTIIKCSWYLKDGKFALWEGQGFCGFHTTDITYHASFGLLALFPELQLRQMRMGAAFQRDDGRVHHFFTPDLDHVDNGFDRVDMNNQFVLMVLRDYLYTGDTGYLSDMWPHVVSAVDSIRALDTDGDGLPDRDTKRNTYDAWNFSGTTVYISVLWLAALKAAAQIAGEMGDNARAFGWNAILEKGLSSLEKRLWNGEYYNLWLSDSVKDESLMTDQLDGEWFLRAAGIGGNICDKRIKHVLQVILDNNFDPDSGLINASCPEGRQTTLFTHKNCQAEAVWTGIGYVTAALCLSVGLRNKADEIVGSIHENQARFGLLWNHWECGHHYTRPLSSWTTLTAALGLKVDSAKKTIGFAPVAENITLPLCLPGILGTVKVKNGSVSIHITQGSIEGWTVLRKR